MQDALIAVSSYLDEIRRTDINRVDGARRDPARVGKLLRALARNVATAAAVTRIAADTGDDEEDNDGQIARNTISDLNSFGLLFESLVVRDLRIYGQRADAQVLHYRDNTELEVDATVEARAGRWLPSR